MDPDWVDVFPIEELNMGDIPVRDVSLPGGKFLVTFLNVHQQDGGVACLKFEDHKNKKPTVRL